ncbi:AbiU2 domain-containing protein [Salegentibacter mishustinae]|uniref:HEPN AbiU2-like domain-containing protein n=1 Tax=Salegentibacter mishustinae TaxID=270918 RepID=A0A0Q9ZLL6_9FLAO|nr:hypothetical protein [Salegentibacter mishustinae]KRG29719.1 hypothetical protein APR42_14860 [Salegentibacter mishustinae]PNW21164.1 hypothetical protein APB85_07810 [Salegentibacter mishustinae]PZX60931.1 hypothetical protein LY54_03129 [Salegentibacter mishustinae]GGW99942.1 hypothetical protein GCM10008086_31370 [Salegentibacter mishustinae]
MKENSEILKHKLSEIREILLELECLKQDIRSIHNPEEEYFERMIKKSSFFYRLYLNYTKLFVIDCHKLIDKKEHFNILNLINFSQSNLNKIDWHKTPTHSSLEILKTKFLKTSKHFNDISLLRNKVFAHTDRKKSEIKYNITLKDFWEVLTSLQEIFREINLHYDNTNWQFQILYEKPTSIKNSFKYLKIRDLYYESFKSDFDIFTKEEVKKIIRT